MKIGASLLVVPLFIIGMLMDINPIQNTIADRFVNMDNRLSALERGDQPYQGDWVGMAPSEFIYSSANEITTSRNFTDVLQVGDKLRISQAGGYKYFYITNVTTVSIEIYAGGDYIFTSGLIEEIAMSRVGAPIGFPVSFLDSNPTVEFSGVLTHGTPSVKELRTTMINRIIQIHFALSVVISAGSGSVSVVLPALRTNTNNYIQMSRSFIGTVVDGAAGFAFARPCFIDLPNINGFSNTSLYYNSVYTHASNVQDIDLYGEYSLANEE